MKLQKTPRLLFPSGERAHPWPGGRPPLGPAGVLALGEFAGTALWGYLTSPKRRPHLPPAFFSPLNRKSSMFPFNGESGGMSPPPPHSIVPFLSLPVVEKVM